MDSYSKVKMKGTVWMQRKVDWQKWIMIFYRYVIGLDLTSSTHVSYNTPFSKSLVLAATVLGTK